jgi:hypothetical protein
VAHAGEIGWYLDKEGGSDGKAFAGGQGRGQAQFKDIDILAVGLGAGFDPIDGKCQMVDVTVLLYLFQLIPTLFQLGQLPVEGRIVILVGIGPAVDIYIMERIGRIVAIDHGLEAIEGVSGIVKGDPDVIAYFLLPVWFIGQEGAGV